MPDPQRPLDRPAPPPTAFAARVASETLARASEAIAAVSPHTGAPPDLHAALDDVVAAATDRLVALSHDLADHPETAFAEHRSAAAVADLVEDLTGLSVERGAYGLETGLACGPTSGTDGPTVAIMSEYDALPGIGHACGHNIIAAAGVGAFAALAAVAADGRLPGRAVWFGTPAEEGGAGKELMAREGMLDGVDAALMVHPFGFDAAEHVFLGRRIARVRFTGVTAHASAQPFLGRNALDAATLAYQGIGLARQQVPPSDRIHAVVTAGGERPNVIPDRAELLFYVRSRHPDTLLELSTRLDQIAAGAALMTGCGVDVVWDEQPATLPVRANAVLAARWSTHLGGRGRRVLPPGVLPELLAASTDFGNVSYRVPSLHPMIAVSAPEVSLHTADFATAARSEAGDRAVVDGAVGLARTALDYLADTDLRAAVHADFETSGGAVDVPAYFDPA